MFVTFDSPVMCQQPIGPFADNQAVGFSAGFAFLQTCSHGPAGPGRWSAGSREPFAVFGFLGISDGFEEAKVLGLLVLCAVVNLFVLLFWFCSLVWWV